MIDEEELGRQRLAERRAYRLTLTDDVHKLIEALQRDHPAYWSSYRKTVDEEGMIEDNAWMTIVRSSYLMFPGRTPDQIGDLHRRMLDMVREDLGKEKWE